MNKEGFTLIELLAVIIVLALVLVVTIPSITTSINNNKLSALHTLSKEVAKWYDETVINDKISTDKVLGSATSDTWYCLNNVGGVNVAEKYGLSNNDLVLSDGKVFDDMDGDFDIRRIDLACSAIRVVNGSAEVLLIGRPSGKYSKSNTYSYALSTEKKGNFFEY